MADTVPVVLDQPLVPHDRRSVRQKRPRSRVLFCAVLTCLSLMSASMVASRADAQNSAAVRDSLAVPLFQLRVSAAPDADSPRGSRAGLKLTGTRIRPPVWPTFGFGQTDWRNRPAEFRREGASSHAGTAPFPGPTASTDAASAAANVAADAASSAGSSAAAASAAPGSARGPERSLVRSPQAQDRLPAPSSGKLQPEPELAFLLNSRLEGRFERLRNDRCAIVQYRALGSNCSATWTPGFNFQLDVVSKGTVADRIHVDLDFNSQREYDASNNISVRYEGKPGRAIEGVEIGNISFLPPQSRFITSGIPSGNYGVLARGRMGALSYTGVAAQQKGNVTKDRTFLVGDRALQQELRALEDIGMELRRFFITVDPRQFAGYPNIDILNRSQMLQLAASLPDSVRPSRLYIYKQLIGAINPNPRGPQLSVRGARNSARQIYELLRENVDYYVDPSQLWIALVAPLARERATGGGVRSEHQRRAWAQHEYRRYAGCGVHRATRNSPICCGSRNCSRPTRTDISSAK